MSVKGGERTFAFADILGLDFAALEQWFMLIVAMVMTLMLQAAPTDLKVPAPPGMTVSPKSDEVLSVEKTNPVARRCAQLGDALATKVRGEVGDVQIRKGSDGGTTWSAILLLAKHPPNAAKMSCDARSFTIANDTFGVAIPQDEIPWPYCGWGLSKEERVGVVCSR